LQKKIQGIRNVLAFGERKYHSLEEAVSRYLIENKEDRGIERQYYALRPLVDAFGEIDIGAIRAEMFDDYMETRGVSGSTLTREFGALRAVLGCATTKWRDESGRYWLEQVPTLPSPEEDGRLPRPITQDEQVRLLKEMPGYLASMCLFALHTGCRDQEICGLKWDWEHSISDTDRMVFVIPREATKNGKEKIVPLNSIAASVVNSFRGKNAEWVFAPKGNRISRLNARAFREARERCGLKDVRPHDLRHTFAVRLRGLDVPKQDIADLLGHSHGDVTDWYARATIERLIKCVDLLVNSGRSADLILVRKRAA
jgi:integrase